MKQSYRTHLLTSWKKAEELAVEVGCSDNKVVIAFFKKIAVGRIEWDRL